MSQQELERLQKENETLKSRIDQIEKQQKQSTKARWNFRLWLAEQSTTFFVGKNLKESLLQLYSELPHQVTKETMADLSTNLIKRLTRIGLFAFIVAFIPLLVLGIQTYLLSSQNKKLDIQNEKITIQTNIEEANRRSSLIHLMSNIMDEMSQELKPKNEQDTIRNLSTELIGRMAALSHAFKPYRYLENDTLSKKVLSPERGQLLIALAKSKLDSKTYQKIFDEVKFSSSDLRGVDFGGVDFGGADFGGVDFGGVDLRKADFGGADLRRIDFGKANLEEANFRKTFLFRANLEGANLGKANLNGANLEGANLGKANLNGANLEGANLWGADLGRANLTGADLRRANLTGADLRFAGLKEAYVDNSTWFNQMEKASIEGIKELQEEYFIESIPQVDQHGEKYHLIKPKK